MNLHPRRTIVNLSTLFLIGTTILTQFGLPQSAFAIAGGGEAQPGTWPWAVALVDANSSAFDGQFCGAALIAPEWVLTAAHCLDDTQANEVDAIIGRHNLNSDEGERIGIAQISVHPGWVNGYGQDVALLRLANPSAQPAIAIASPHLNNLYTPGITAITLGWGQLSEQGSAPATLQQVSVPIVSTATCNTAYDGEVTSTELCAGFDEGGRDSCYGDSGGPLVVPDGNGSWLHAGIVSWGEGCGLAGYYGVYARTADSADWISGVMSGATPVPSSPTDSPAPNDESEYFPEDGFNDEFEYYPDDDFGDDFEYYPEEDYGNELETIADAVAITGIVLSAQGQRVEADIDMLTPWGEYVDWGYSDYYNDYLFGGDWCSWEMPDWCLTPGMEYILVVYPYDGSAEMEFSVTAPLEGSSYIEIRLE